MEREKRIKEVREYLDSHNVPETDDDNYSPAFDKSNYTQNKLAKPLHEKYITNRRIDDLMKQRESSL